MSEQFEKTMLQIVCLSLLVGGIVAMLSGCTLIIDSSNVNTEVVPAVSAVELTL